jgi:hypothetical protein
MEEVLGVGKCLGSHLQQQGCGLASFVVCMGAVAEAFYASLLQ